MSSDIFHHTFLTLANIFGDGGGDVKLGSSGSHELRAPAASRSAVEQAATHLKVTTSARAVSPTNAAISGSAACSVVSLAADQAKKCKVCISSRALRRERIRLGGWRGTAY